MALRFVLVLAGLLLAGQAGALPARAGPPPSASLVEAAYRRGDIDRATALLYKAYTVVAPGRLPAAFQSPTPGKDATPILRELQAGWASLGPETRAQLAALGFARLDGGAVVLARPRLSGERLYDTTHFRVHYAARGIDRPPRADVNPANGIPDYVEDVSREMENVWTTELLTFGWLQPPPDGTAGGDSRYDVYLQNIPYYGYAATDGLVGDNPNSPDVVETAAATSYIVLDNDYVGFPNGDLTQEYRTDGCGDRLLRPAE
jgi:hypothetical protein